VDITQYIQKVMLPRWYLTQVVWPWSRTCTKLFLVPWSSICHGVQLGTMWFAFYYAQNGWLITSCVKIHQTASTSRVSDTKILLALEFTGVNIFFNCEDTMDISTVHHWVWESRESGRNLDLNDQPQSWSLVSTTQYLKRQELTNL